MKSEGDCVILAISTFRYSECAVAMAVERAQQKRLPLVVVVVTDRAIAGCMVGCDLIPGSRLRDQYEEYLLRKHRRINRARADRTVSLATQHGISSECIFRTGDPVSEVLAVTSRKSPEVLICSKAGSPSWLQRLFGSPVDKLIRGAGCAVMLV